MIYESGPTEKEVESAARKATEALYGGDIDAFRIRTLLPFPNETE